MRNLTEPETAKSQRKSGGRATYVWVLDMPIPGEADGSVKAEPMFQSYVAL